MALLTGLLLMAAVGVLAVTAAGSMTLQQHQAANFEDRIRAAASADLAASYAMAWLFSRAGSERQADCVSACLLPAGIGSDNDVPEYPEFESLAWWRANGTPAGSHPVSGEFLGFSASGSTDALWVMEELHFDAAVTPGDPATPAAVGYYRIFSRAGGSHPGSVVVNEAIVARPWADDVVPAAFPPDQPMAAFCARLDENLPCGTLAWRRRR